MKWVTGHTVLLLVLVLMPGILAGQNDVPMEVFCPEQYQEQIRILADRNVYVSGDQLRFRAYNTSTRQLTEYQWSRVLYVEILSASNTPVARGKFEFGHSGTCGQVLLPDSVSTGNYFLRAYTKWMRNYPASGYAYVPLVIINPYQSRIQELIPQALDYGEQPDTASLAGTGNGIPLPDKAILCSPDKKTYSRREKITLNIQSRTPDGSPEAYCLSVARKGCHFTPGLYPLLQDKGPFDPPVFNGDLYYPETRGLSIAGEIINADDGQVIPYVKVYLTLLGDKPDCYEIYADRSGRFRSSIPHHTGSQDVLITALPRQDVKVRINIEKEFSGEYSDLPGSTTAWWAEHRTLVEELMINRQVMRAFGPADTLSHDRDDESSDIHFYGKPDYRYFTRDYIALPNLEEFFYELIPSVLLKSDKDSKHFVVSGEQGPLVYHPPLVLLDYVPVLNLDEFLNLSPSDIEYIDIVNSIFIRGSNYYGGIINLVSKRGDRAGASLAENASFFSFGTFTHQVETSYPGYSGERAHGRVPDLRTSLYWDPDIIISAGDTRSLDFYASDVAGSYVALIRGVTGDGRLIWNTADFEVK